MTGHEQRNTPPRNLIQHPDEWVQKQLAHFTAEDLRRAGQALAVITADQQNEMTGPGRVAGKARRLNIQARKLLTDTAECGFTFWGQAPGTGFTWATDERRRFHAVHSTTRAGQRQSRHACGLLRQKLLAEIDQIAGISGILAVPGFWGDVAAERDTEIQRRRAAMANPAWLCDCDGPVITHPPTADAAVEAIATTST